MWNPLRNTFEKGHVNRLDRYCCIVLLFAHLRLCSPYAYPHHYHINNHLLRSTRPLRTLLDCVFFSLFSQIITGPVVYQNAEGFSVLYYVLGLANQDDLMG